MCNVHLTRPQVCCNHEAHLRGNVYVQFSRYTSTTRQPPCSCPSPTLHSLFLLPPFLLHPSFSLHSLSPSLPPLSPSFPPPVPLHPSSLLPLSEQECADAYKAFNGRWYAMRQLSCQFCPVVKWKTAICGQSGHGRGRGRVHDQARGRVHDQARGRVHDQARGRVHDQARARVHDRARGRVHDRARESDSAGRVCRDSLIKGRYSLVCRDD